jgi:hypothetical protein
MRKRLISVIVISAFLALAAIPVLAEEAWKAEFDALCSKTGDAMNLSDEELRTLIERCDKLRPEMEKLDESAQRFYLRRLQKCRDLFQFVIDSKKGG